MSVPCWNDDLGVWDGEKAADGSDLVPKPLYIFGYGSLIWRPDILEAFPSCECLAIGWKRIFAQRSCDHRGTTRFPGVVLNLVSHSCLYEKGYCYDIETCRCHGLMWLIPDNETDRILDELDYREKGGYSRQLIKVMLTKDFAMKKKGDLVDALVYTGLEYNPNFYLPKNEFRLLPDVSLCTKRTPVSEIISVAHGPSGFNTEYLLKLEHFLHEMNIRDDYLSHLAACVKLCVGPWRARLHQYGGEWATGKMYRSCCDAVVGWGSNEFLQLIENKTVFDDEAAMRDHKKDPVPFRFCSIKQAVAQQQPASDADASYLKDLAALARLSRKFVVAGGGTSAVVDEGVATLRGKLVKYMWSALGGGSDDGNDRNNVVLQGVESIALGQDHMLLLLQSGWVTCFGENHCGQCCGPEEFVLPPSKIALQEVNGCGDLRVLSISAKDHCAAPAVTVMKLAVGLRHSAAIANTALFTWGDARNNQALLCSTESGSRTCGSWSAPDGALLVDVACGATFTVVADHLGRVFVLGKNKHGQHSSAVSHSLPRQLPGLPTRVVWQKICCGWSHCLLKGVRTDGSVLWMAWGRSDLAQFLVDEVPAAAVAGATDGRIDEDGWRAPQPLKGLPNGNAIVEAWCGSEFSVAADEEGQLWGCGWNEHNNLTGSTTDNAKSWIPLRSSNGTSQAVLKNVWDGALSCGGAHILALKS